MATAVKAHEPWLRWHSAGTTLTAKDWDEWDLWTRIARLRQVLEVAAAAASAAQIPVELPFSRIVLQSFDLTQLIERWKETNEPLVHLVIGIEGVGGSDRDYRTVGLRAFARLEIILACATSDDVRDGLRDLYRLARHVLLGFVIVDGAALIGVRGRIALGAANNRPSRGYAFQIVDGHTITD